MEGRLPGALIYGKFVYHGTDGNYIKLPGRPPAAPIGGLVLLVCMKITQTESSIVMMLMEHTDLYQLI
jgi:hypothetical protein